MATSPDIRVIFQSVSEEWERLMAQVTLAFADYPKDNDNTSMHFGKPETD
jgi:hypothetical protein